MKFKLYKELLSEDKILSHVFLNCCPSHLSNKIAEKTKEMCEIKEMSNDDIEEQRVVDMKLFIENEEVDLRNFFDELMEQFTSIVKKEATKMVKEQTSNKLYDIQDKLNTLSQLTDDISNNIDWKYDKNPFLK
jgi:polyhydroxyalkanoate synthesis regulator protein